MATLLKNVRLKSYGKVVSVFTKSRLISTNNNIRCHCFNQYLLKSRLIRYSNFNVKSIHTTSNLNKIIPFYLSDIGEGIREVIVKEWFVKVGDNVNQFDNICEVQSDKASATITSRFDGKISKLHYKIDDVALVGQPLVDIDVEEESSSESSDSESSDDEQIEAGKKHKILATPAVRRIAMQNKIDMNLVNATGKGGRVLKEDILKFLNISSEDSNDVQKMKNAEKVEVPQFKTPLKQRVPEKQPVGEDKTVPVSGYTKVMVKTMTAALKIPHFVYSDEIDMNSLVSMRNDVKKAAAESGVSVSFMPFFIKAASLALHKYPILNSSLDENCENVTYKASHNISIAMDTPNGLVVPNIKNVQQKSIIQIASEMNRLQKDGKNNTLKPEDLTSGTFSLSNIGIIGGTYTKPVILSPQVVIGALGKIQVLPRFDENGNVIKSHILCVSWSADHRIVDGVTMARFSNVWKHYIENPNYLLLEL